jgi:hypothetical protein
VADRPFAELTEPQRQVLVAVVEGYRAREGMKDRIRALNEWEIARRSGMTTLSYAEYMRDPSRNSLIGVLSQLERLGLVSTWERGANYDTFVPTEQGSTTMHIPDGQGTPSQAQTVGAAPEPNADPVIERLDEIIRLLHAIERRLAGAG